MPAAHEHQGVAGTVQAGFQTDHVAGEIGRGQLDLARRRGEDLGDPRHHRAEVHPVRFRLDAIEREPVGDRAGTSRPTARSGP